jgi:hypothetical protein
MAISELSERLIPSRIPNGMRCVQFASQMKAFSFKRIEIKFNKLASQPFMFHYPSFLPFCAVCCVVPSRWMSSFGWYYRMLPNKAEFYRTTFGFVRHLSYLK